MTKADPPNPKPASIAGDASRERRGTDRRRLERRQANLGPPPGVPERRRGDRRSGRDRRGSR